MIRKHQRIHLSGAWHIKQGEAENPKEQQQREGISLNNALPNTLCDPVQNQL
jgi:hypothetical protein